MVDGMNQPSAYSLSHGPAAPELTVNCSIRDAASAHFSVTTILKVLVAALVVLKVQRECMVRGSCGAEEEGRTRQGVVRRRYISGTGRAMYKGCSTQCRLLISALR